MTIENALKMIEDDHLEKDIKDLLPKDRMTFYQTLKEFTRAKIQRSTFEPVGTNETQILIKYEPNTTTPHKDISITLDKPKKD